MEATWQGKTIPLGGEQRRAVLTALLLKANSVVMMDELARFVWDESPPARARSALQMHVSRLRKTFSIDPSVRILHKGQGYALLVDDDDVDLFRFRRLVRQARTAGDPRAARPLLREALRQWGGTPLSGVSSDALRQVSDLLVQEHLDARENLLATEVELGGHAEVVNELAELAVEHPLRERIHELLVLALYRSARQAEALETYNRVRRLLVDELGVEPGLPLRTLQERILAQEPALLETESPPVQPARRRPSNFLPRAVPGFTGREEELRQLLTAVEQAAGTGNPHVVTIGGMAGVGKTAFATQAAHRLLDQYPDLQLFVDLQGHSPDRPPENPGDVLHGLLTMLGFPPEGIPAQQEERSALWRAALRDQRALLVLDSAVSAAQIQPLLPGAGHSVVLVTGRGGLDLPAGTAITLQPLSIGEAVELFHVLIGDRSRLLEAGSLRDVLEYCGRLPQGILAAAARLRRHPTWRAHDLAQYLRDSEDLVAELSTDSYNLAGAIAASYRRLTDDERRVLQLAADAPGAVDAASVGALGRLPVSRARALLEKLLTQHLVHETGPGRYQAYTLVREYAGRHVVKVRTGSA